MDTPLSQMEAKLAADYLREKGKSVKGGWVTLWRLRPAEIAKTYDVTVSGLLEAIRRGV